MISVDKRALVALLRDEIAKEIAAMARAARDAAEAATHEEAKPENDKDTRGLEASYLARGQAARVRELERSDNTLQFLVVKDVGAGEGACVGALVELESGGARTMYFVAPTGGGMRVQIAGTEVLVVTPQSPLGQAVVGKRVGDVIELRVHGKLREHEVVEVR